ncbi:hypothetical protein FE810_05430 [Thalassotalea litorea]|uniref:DUF2946 domain-containing protein n=1 Tax=Thalassotalea litorea TaxID=2020715 RepID=A0A5R9ILK8_9GAMM|nr:hypothetical protein [Thalassotalea litorea]TLU66162.1 hypothetical protein FE810_05430 [Thalassotalea litorea]
MKLLRYPIAIALFIIHLFSSVNGAFASNQQPLVTANGSTVVMICTGQGVKYIDLDRYYQLGELVFVDIDDSELPQPNDCSTCLIFAAADIEDYQVANAFNRNVTASNPSLAIHKQHRFYLLNSAPYHSRAPPLA